MLQRRGRLTYRALKRQFNIDDDYLEDLKAELIQGQRLAVDEEGAVLVWTGDTVVAAALSRSSHAAAGPAHRSPIPRSTWPRRSSPPAAPSKASASRSPSCSPMWRASPRSPSSSIPRSCTTSSIAASSASRRRCTASRARSTSTRAMGSWPCSVRPSRTKTAHAGRARRSGHSARHPRCGPGPPGRARAQPADAHWHATRAWSWWARSATTCAWTTPRSGTPRTWRRGSSRWPNRGAW